MGVSTMILQDGTLCLVEPKPENPRLDRRVFRTVYAENTPRGTYEWAHYADIEENNSRARWYGWGGNELPDTMRAA